LLQPGRDFGQLPLDAQSQGTQLSAEVERTQREKGNDEQGQARDLRVHGEQDGDGRHREHDAFRQPQDCTAREKADALDILDRAGQQLPRFGPVVIREGERSQLVVDIAPQVVRHALRCDLGPPALEVEGRSLEQGQSQQGEHRLQQERRVAAADAFVHDEADKLGDKHGQARRDEHAGIRAHRQPPVRPQASQSPQEDR